MTDDRFVMTAQLPCGTTECDPSDATISAKLPNVLVKCEECVALDPSWQ